MSRSRRVRRSVLCLATAVVAVACARAGDATSPKRSTRLSLAPSPTALPEFDFAGFQALLSGLRGKPVVVNVWASWCGPCRQEAPGLAKVAREFEGRVQFLGVDILDQRRSAREFIEWARWPYPSVFDPTGEIRDGLGFIGQPVTILYDASGKRRWAWSGAVDGSQLRSQITGLL